MNDEFNKKQWHNAETTGFKPVEERVSGGSAPVLLEIICERVHCVMYDYAISTVDMVVEEFGNQVEIQTIIRRDGLKNAARYLKICQRAGKFLSVPTILINGDVLFTTIPLPSELSEAIQSYLDRSLRQEKRNHPLGHIPEEKSHINPKKGKIQ